MRKPASLLLVTLAISSIFASACAAETGSADDESSDDALVANFDKTGKIDLTKTTHVLLVGDSDELGVLPLYSATTKARRYAQLYPSHQITIFVTSSVTDASVAATGATVVQQEPFGSAVSLADLSRLSAPKLVAALLRFKRIASLDFFGHSSPFGALLEGSGDGRVLAPGVPTNLGALASHFARDTSPYVTLNGCNGGVTLAPQLSQLWKLPVSGALSASNFETLMSDGRYYADDATMWPQGLSRATKNNRSFGPSLAPSCTRGACMRMKPENAPYYGVWSRQDTGFQYGLNYYKFFCNYDDTQSSCARGMAASLYAFPSIKPIDHTASDDDVTDVLADYFCDTNKDPGWFDTCRAGLLDAEANGKPFSPMKAANDYSLECDFSGCEQKFRCDMVSGVPQQKSCVWVSASCAPSQSQQSPAACRTKNTKKQTTVAEFRRFVEGHRILRGD